METPGSHNLATRSPAERLAVAADRLARLLIYRRNREYKGRPVQGKEFFKIMGERQVEPLKSALRDRLSYLLRGGK